MSSSAHALIGDTFQVRIGIWKLYVILYAFRKTLALV